MGVFHLMFVVGVHTAGRFFSVEIPEPSGPRHCGQFPACAFSEKTLTPASMREIPMLRVKANRFTVLIPLRNSSVYFPVLLVAAGTGGSPKAKRCETVRTITRPSEIAGVAI